MFTMLKNFKETSDVSVHSQAGQPCSIHMKNVVNMVNTRINQNPSCEHKILSREMNFLLRTVSNVITDTWVSEFPKDTPDGFMTLSLTHFL